MYYIFFIDSAWKEIKTFAEETLESQSPKNAPLAPLTPLPQPLKPRKKLPNRFSFTRSVSREIFERQSSLNGLKDGCTPIFVMDQTDVLASLYKATKKNILERSKCQAEDSTDEASN